MDQTREGKKENFKKTIPGLTNWLGKKETNYWSSSLLNSQFSDGKEWEQEIREKKRGRGVDEKERKTGIDPADLGASAGRPSLSTQISTNLTRSAEETRDTRKKERFGTVRESSTHRNHANNDMHPRKVLRAIIKQTCSRESEKPPGNESVLKRVWAFGAASLRKTCPLERRRVRRGEEEESRNEEGKIKHTIYLVI